MRQLRLRMPDETIRSIMVDENQPVANLMVLICTMLGITNHDEYSLIGTGKNTINGRRKERNDGRIIDQKMEQLKKKLKTDEDLAWLDHSKTLDEQEIHEQDVVILRRRFFYSDQNVDSRDPIQLGVLYVQTRDAILSGTHPVNLDGACKFAGIQCQAQLGDFVEGKTTRPGFFNLRDYLPAEYAKQKQIERKIFSEHQKYYGLSELEAKARYVNEARGLPTYGVTFFLTKEKVPGKNKLVPCLLGITRDCVMRVDAETKAVLKTWPLTTVKRWAPSKNTFILDFGDYSDSYYCVQTSEGEQISQLIAGYIDIILRRRKAKDHFGIEGDEGATMIEDSVAPSRATIIQNQPTLSRPPSAAPSQLDLSSVAGPTVEKIKLEQGPHVEPPELKQAFEVRGKARIGFESGPITQYVTNYELSLPQRDLQDRLEQAQDAIEEAQKVLDKPGSVEVDRSRFDERDVELKKSELTKQFANINAATAQLVSLSAIPEEELDYPALNQAVETVASNLPTVAKDVKLVASLMDDEESGDRLIDAARRLCKAFSDLLNAAEPGPTVPRQILISAASRVGDATQALLFSINNDEDEKNSDLLLSLAKSVASSAAHLSLKAKDVASNCQDVDVQNMVISSATQCALATSQMVATAKIVAPTIHDPSCQRKLMDACREVQRAVEGIQNSACSRPAIRDQASLNTINESVTRVNNALDELMHYVSNIRRHGKSTHQTTTTTTTKTVNRSTLESAANQKYQQQQQQQEPPPNNELVNQARTLARATAKLIQELNPDENNGESSSSARHQYQDNSNYTHRTTISPDDSHHQSRERIHKLYQEDGDNHLTRQQQNNKQSKHSMTTITTTLYDETNNNNNQQQQHQRPLSMYESSGKPDSMGGRLNESAYDEVTRTTTTHSEEHHHQQQEPEIELPEAAISGIVGDLDTTIMYASTGTLRAQDENDNYLYHRENVLMSAKALVEDTRPLVASASSDQAQLARAARDSVITMSKLAETVKSSAASLSPNQVESQVCLIRSVKDVAVSLSQLIGSTKSALGCDSNDPRLLDVKDSAKSMVSSVTSLLKTVKSVEEEQQRGLRVIEQTLEAIEQDLVNYGHPRSQLEEEPIQRASARVLSEELVRVSRPITMATSKSVHAASSGAQNDAIVAANMGRKAINDLLQTVRQVSHQLDSFELRCRVHDSGRDCAVSYKHLLELLHRIFQHPSLASANPEIKQELINQSKNIATCVTDLVECSELIKQLEEQQQQQQEQHHQDQQQHHHNQSPSTTTSQQHQHQQYHDSNLNSNTLDATASTSSHQARPDSQWLDPHDPSVIAESELLGAASSIDAAAKKLENLKPRTTSVKLPHEDLNFDEIILEAAKSIIEATAALLRAASASQRELLVDGRLDETETFYASDNNQWSEGLVSAARMVAAATHSLVEAANALVQGQASEERLISAAKQVASSTNQLLVACKVKADPDSRTMTRLSNAGQQVKRATDNLVRAAQQAIEHDEEKSLIISNRKVSGIAQEISAREQILRKEKELQVAKTQLMAIRKAKYANRPDDYQGYGGSLS